MRLSATLRPVTRLTGSLGVATITTFGDATALVTDILAPKTAYIASGKVTGTCAFDADTSDATATESDILLGETAYAGGVELTGTLLDYEESFKATVSCVGDITVLPPDITVIKDDAFNNSRQDNLTNPSMKLTSLPSGITSIGAWAFFSCQNLVLTELPPGLLSIGESAFRKCTGLVSITIPVGVSILYNYTFRYCSNLQTFIAPGIEIIVGANAALGNNSKLETVILGSIGHPVTSIYYTAFFNDNQLGLTITIYVTPGTQPLVSSPWGATNATIVYRSAVDGSVL